MNKIQILDNKHKYAAIAYAHKMFNETERKHPIPTEYLDKMFSFDELFCFKCGKTIEIGAMYRSNRHSKPNIVRKYYHNSCYESMFY